MHKPKKFKEKVKVLEVNTPKFSQKKQINLFDIPEIFDSEGNFNLNLYLILRSETLDNFSFNRITSNRSFTPTFIDFNNHTITFKPFDRESALLLPDRLGFYKFDTMASLIRNITTYNAGDLEKVKDILIYSYKISYGVELDREKIVFKISNNRIWKVTYNSKSLETLVKVSTEISDNWSQEKVRSLKSTRSYRPYVYKKNLFIPPSIDLTQGLKIPFDGIYSSAKLRTQIQKKLGFVLNREFFNRYKFDDQKYSLKTSFKVRSINEIGSKMYHEDFLTQSLAHRNFKQYSKDKNLLLENILKYVNKQTYIPDPDFEVARHTLDFILSSGGDCDDRALFVHNFAQVFDIDCGVLIYKTYNDGLHAIAVCEYESSKPGFSISDTGVVRFSKSGKYKPMDYDKAGDLSIPFDSKNPFIVILKRQEGEIKVFSDFEN